MFSGDCFGNVLCWDVRSKGCVQAWNLGPLAINKLAVDPAKSLLAGASDSQAVILIDLNNQSVSQQQDQSSETEHPKVSG